MLLAFFLLVNVIAPETRKGVYRHSVHHFVDATDPEKIRRRVAKGEIKLHISNDGPAWWWEEVWAGLILTKRMIFQAGFFVMMVYLAWINAQLTLVILLLGALLSRDYEWKPQWVGLAALAIPLGAALAMPLAKASWFSRARTTPPRTDSMTMRTHITRTSHFLRRLLFSLLLPLAGLGYCLTASGPPLHWSACIVFAGFVGFLTDLGIAECVGIIMETFDTCDLQPGANTKHRAQSMSSSTKRRRTNYSSFPRVCAGFFAAQSLGFFLAAAATVVSGRVTNAHGAQYAMAIVAGILLGVTLLFFIAVTRWKNIRVIPSYTADAGRPSKEWHPLDSEWKPVIIGNPSGHMRRMNILEMGKWSRWSEIRRLNKLSKD
ncbi:hypothetical protein PRZ48_004301 [Zasmidium cellare]|uniref:Uncharacterized protein n=1 Tax=Zasmidium cellare TaxID=395010 RepID=A0ABR0EP51_ZASCE|nr:hypothetical protein PRZ48_004301 [Zasmidium cellare]